MARFFKISVGLLTVCFLSACLRLMEQDFEKATLVSHVELPASTAQTRTFSPPAGTARLILAVPNYRCGSAIEGEIELVMRSQGGTLFSARKSVYDLTWSYGEGSCDAYGYIAGGEGRIDIREESRPVTVVVNSTGIKGAPRTGATVWLIYGDRVPTARIFGEKK